MKKRILHWMLVFCMVFTIMPMTAFASETTYGDFAVATTVEDGCNYNSGVLTFTKEGEYTVSMVEGKTSTADVIVVNAENVALNLNGVNIGAPTGTVGAINGADALTATSGTILNVIADSILTGGKGADSGAFQYSTTGTGGNGIKGNVTISGTAKLIVTAGLAGLAGGWYASSGNAISGNLAVSGGATVILDGRWNVIHPGQAITGTLSATDSIVKAGSSPSTVSTVQEPNKTYSDQYITIAPPQPPTVGTISAIELYAGENFVPTMPAITANGSTIDSTIHSEFDTTGTCWQIKGASDADWSVIAPNYLVRINLAESIYRLRVAYTVLGSSEIKYVYSNEAAFDVALRQPTLELTATPASPQNVGGQITLTATMKGADLTAGAGLHDNYKIIFKSNGIEIGQTALDTATGVATYTYTPPTAANYSFTAERGSDHNFNLGATSNIVPYTMTAATGTIFGTVKDSTNATVSGAIVTLTPSSSLLSTTTGEDGSYTIPDVPNGNYNIVVKKGDVTVTDSIKMNDTTVRKDVQLLSGEKSTVVESKEGTPPIAAGGMNELLSDSKIGETLSPSEKSAVDAGGSVEIKMIAEKKTDTQVAEDKTKIQTLATDKKLAMFIDLSVLKTVKDGSGVALTTDEKLTTLADIVTVDVPIPAELQGKTGISVYRVHNGVAQVMQKDLADENGEYFTISLDGTYITLHVKNFSTYAMGYTPDATTTGSGSGGKSSSSYNYYTITATSGDGGIISPSGSVSVREGLSKSFTFTPASGYQISDVVIDGKSVGEKANFTFDNVKDKHTIKVSFKKLEQADSSATFVFSDVSEKDWFYTSVYKSIENGWFTGTSDTTFSPYMGTTRAMIATALWRMEKQPTATTSSNFNDVVNGAWYYNGVVWAQGNQVVKGYGDGTYGPNDNITREQLASILYRYAELKGYDVTTRTNLDHFSDGNTVSTYAIETMRWAVAANIIAGKSDNNLDPTGKATRAEVATILTRFDELLSKI